MSAASTIAPPSRSGWLPLQRHTLDAAPGACRAARRLLSDWLAPLPTSAELGEDLALAVNEAVANAVDHAYPTAASAGDLVLQMRLGERPGDRTQWIIVTVTDHGRWRPVPEDNGDRGRGLQLINELTDRRELTTTSHGTTVTMARQLT